jgi:hypothetical protein
MVALRGEWKYFWRGVYRAISVALSIVDCPIDQAVGSSWMIRNKFWRQPKQNICYKLEIYDIAK